MNNNGLSNSDVIKMRELYGNNKIESKKRTTIFKLVIESLNDPIIKILLLALLVKVIFLFSDSSIYETFGIAIAIFLASFISVLSEYGSEQAFEKLSKDNSLIDVKVIRNGNKVLVPIDEIVVNDIVCLDSGDRVPADGVLISGSVFVDESSLTGETNEKNKNVDDVLYRGSVVSEGSGILKVTHVGTNSYYGKIAKDIQEVSVMSPLKLKLRDLAKFISKIGYFCAVLVFLSYMINVIFLSGGFVKSEFFSHLLYALTLSVAVVVMAVPEGLPMMITLVLSSNMKRLIKKNVLVKKLVGIETSGSLNILFTDKTGTLTEGLLKVDSVVDAELNEYNDYFMVNNKDIFDVSLICNNDSFLLNGKSEGGNTTDRAILDFCKSDIKSQHNIVDKIKFNSKIKYSAVKTSFDDNYYYKGAFEVILDKCVYYLKSNGEKRVLVDKEKILKYISSKTREAYRVIALARGESFNRLTLIGFVLLKDNIRKSSIEGINSIKNAGIQVVMVTGDASDTANSVALKTGIISSKNDISLNSDEFNFMSDEEVKKILPRLRVLSRSLPGDKSRLVRLSQELDLVVGMTGDGVNDAPALRKSDVGFSMGSGSEVAKEVSDIVIIDNDISSISTAILYGRTIFKSIRKFITFQLTVNLCAVLLSIIGPFFGILSPITVTQVLWVNMVMDTFAALAFSYEPALNEYMNEEPKKRNESIINKYMINQIVVNGSYAFLICLCFLKSDFIRVLFRYDSNDIYLMSAFFGLFIFIDIFNAFNCRTHRLNSFSNLILNKTFLLIFLFITCVQILLIYFGGELFRTTGLTIFEFEIMIIVAFSVIPVDIIRKIYLKRKKLPLGV